MFGNIVANFEDLTEEETTRYNALYCGLCHSIKARYGQLPRAGLSFDLTFFVVVFNSLYEPEEMERASNCIVHPIEKKTIVQSEYSEYAADLTVLFTYFKCLDDWNDDKKLASRGAAQLLKKSYRKACERQPEAARVIEEGLAKITQIEQQGDTSLDAAATCFGEIMAELFAYKNDHWSETMRAFGHELGRFIYAMDAAIDQEEDARSGSYNPFVAQDIDPNSIRTMLTILIGKASEAFEKLPLVQDIRLLRSVLYAGVWQQYNYHAENRVAHG